MNKTNIDDVYIAMISKEAEKIEEKFSKGESLTPTDIHTLVLKTQYNHINHLDKKLNEVTESVKELEHKFEKLEISVNNKIENFFGINNEKEYIIINTFLSFIQSKSLIQSLYLAKIPSHNLGKLSFFSIIF